MNPNAPIRLTCGLRLSACRFVFSCVALSAAVAFTHAQVGSIPELQRFLQNPPDSQSGKASSDASSHPVVFEANPGPWGKLRCFYVYIEAPHEIVDSYPLPFSKPSWTFPEAAAATLPALFEKAGLPPAMIASVLKSNNVVKENGKLHLFPSVAEIEALTPAMRQVLYHELAKDSENQFHADPVLMTTDTVQEWYKSSKLRRELIDRISRLSYMRGECLAFSDVQVMMNYAQSDAEARTLFKAFTRTRSLMVQMVLDEHTELAPLLEYWSPGRLSRRKDIQPIMQSIIDTDGVEHLGLVHVIPALPRKLLYTYPGPEFARQGVLPDCHWTSLNFFNVEPHEYFLDERLATSSVLQRYDPAQGPHRYGDILFFLDNDRGDAFHSCVYLADDLVFTKNGRNALSPWVIMKLDEVKKIYIHDRNGRVQGYRLKAAAK